MVRQAKPTGTLLPPLPSRFGGETIIICTCSTSGSRRTNGAGTMQRLRVRVAAKCFAVRPSAYSTTFIFRLYTVTVLPINLHCQKACRLPIVSQPPVETTEQTCATKQAG